MYEGGVPVFADIDPRTFNLDPAAVEAAVTERTKAIVAVDIYGYPCELDELRAIADRHGLALIDDSCEALGAEYRGAPIGSHGTSCVFAFYPNKQLTTGEGGMVVTHSEDEWHLIRSLRNQGRPETGRLARARPARLQLPAQRRRGRGRHRPAGAHRRDTGASRTSREALSRSSAAVGRDRVALLRRRRSPPLVVRLRRPASRTTAARERAIATFEREGIGYNRYLPSIHLQPYMVERFGFEEGLCPVAEDVSSRSLALPFFTGIEACRAGARRRGSRVGPVNLQSIDDAEPFATKDGSTIRELHHTAAQSLAEAALEPGQATERHYHGRTEEIYFVTKGAGSLEVDGETRRIRPGDAVLIPPGAWHTLENDGTSELLILCMCAPPYSHEDTFFS